MPTQPFKLISQIQYLRDRALRNRELHGILVLYILLLAGGLWHILGILQWAMIILSSPMITGLGIIPVWLYAQSLSEKNNKKKFLLWCACIWLASTLYEWFGVQTGMIFGYYTYSSILYPLAFDVTLVIGFAWIGMLLSSAALVEKFFRVDMRTAQWGNHIRIAILIGATMTMFDMCMEYAVLRLGYWQWLEKNATHGLLMLGSVPLKNFIGWFCGGTVFALWGLRSGVLQGNFSRWTLHSYTAQLAYFVMVYFKA
jgi:uncharacterized membrane protein